MVVTPKQNPNDFSAGHRSATAINDPNWTVVSGGASAVTVSPADPINCAGTTTGHGSVFVLSPQPVGADKYIWEGDGQGNWCNVPGLASQIAVTPNGTLYAVNSGGELYSWDGTSWTGIAGRAVGVTAASDGSLYVLSNQNGSGDEPIWHYSGGTWTWVPGSGVQIASSWDTKSYSGAGGTIPANALYVLTSQGYIYAATADGSTYVGIPGSASFIAPTVLKNGSGTAGGGVYALAYPLDTGNGSAIWYYDMDSAAWKGVPGAAVSVAAMSLSGGANASVWAIASSAAILTSAIVPTPNATPTPVEAITNSSFSSSVFDGTTGWFRCVASRVTTAGATPINPSPAPVNQLAVIAGSTPAPAGATGDVTQQTTTPSGAAPPSGNANIALVGYASASLGGTPGTGKPNKGNLGICQVVTVPATAPTLTFNWYEGGDDNWSKSDSEVDVYSSTAFTGTNPGIGPTAAPTARLIAENNCYDSAGFEAIFLPAPWGTGTVTVNSTSRWSGCPQTPGGADPGGYTPSSGGGFWYSRSVDMTAYAGTTITLFFGISRDAGASTPTGSGAQYYNYVFLDNVHLRGTGS